jgi:chaperonin GroES
MNFPIKPNEDRVIVKLIARPDKTKTGLHIPENARGTPTMGVVVAVGPGRSCDHCGNPKEPKVEIGWTVVFPEGAGYAFSWDDVEYKTIRGTDIIQYELPHEPVQLEV